MHQDKSRHLFSFMLETVQSSSRSRVRARRKLEQDPRGALFGIAPHHRHLHSIGLLGIGGLPRNGVARREGTSP